MINKLGIIISQPGQNQQFYTLCQSLNKLIDESTNLDVIVFYTEYGIIPFKTKFAMMQLYQIYDYDGVLISTDIETTQFLDKALAAKQKLFYVWNLDWIYNPYTFNILNSVYNNDNIELISRSYHHANILSRVWKKPQLIMRDFDYDKLNTIQ